MNNNHYIKKSTFIITIIVLIIFFIVSLIFVINYYKNKNISVSIPSIVEENIDNTNSLYDIGLTINN